jgi:sulfate permease, SulP family
VLSGTLVALALIPEAIAFSIIAGVDPKVGLYASFSIAVISAFAGGRPAMISAATGSMAVVMVTLMQKHGLQYVFAATVVTGLIQVAIGALKLGRYIRFVPHTVMIGFVNALAIIIFMAQLPQFMGATWHMYALVAAGLAIIYVLPRFTKVVPSALVAIVVLTVFSIATGLNVRTVGDMGELPNALPFFGIPAVPFTLETLGIVLPYAITLAMVGLLESLLTASIVDDMTETPSDKNRECRSQGLANVITGFFGGMAGCAMIGQTVINVKAGGRTRLSTLCAGVFLLIFILLLSDVVVRIPMGALVAVMFMVCIGTFNWRSIITLHRVPVTEGIVMVATVITVVLTSDLAKGVLAGVLLSAIFFARKVAKLVAVESTLDRASDTRVYRVSGQLFFASVTDFLTAFDYAEPVGNVEIDLTHSHLWDGSAVDAIDRVVLRYRRKNVHVTLLGVNEASATLLKKLAIHDKQPALATGASH